MGNVIKAELLRLVSRRFVWVTAIALMAVAVFQSVSMTQWLAPLTEQDYAAAQESYEWAQEEWENWVTSCEAEPGCSTSDWEIGTVEDHLRYVASFQEYVEQQFSVGAVALLVVIVFTIITVSAADFSNGSLATQLTFTPRRGWVLVAKAITGLVAGVGLGLATIAAGLLASTLTFLSLRPPSELTVNQQFLATAGRFAVTVLVVSLLAALVAMLMGGTVGALLVSAGTGIGSVLLHELAWERPDLQALLPAAHAIALATGDYTAYRYDEFTGGGTYLRLLTFTDALGYSSVLLILVALLTAWRFQRRDLLI